MPPKRKPAAERFWSKVEKTEGCWHWTATIRRDGYGYINLGGRKAGAAHRLSYEMHHGPIPPGLLVMHTCDVRRCVNPAHLKLGTHIDNTRDMFAKGRWHSGQSAKTHCRHGHPFDAENTLHTIRDGRPQRSCRICCRVNDRRYKERRRAARLAAKAVA